MSDWLELAAWMAFGVVVVAIPAAGEWLSDAARRAQTGPLRKRRTNGGVLRTSKRA